MLQAWTITPPSIDSIDDLDSISDRVQDTSLVWVDLLDPTPGELELLAREFVLHPLWIKDAEEPGQRPHAAAREDAVGGLDVEPQDLGGGHAEAEAHRNDRARRRAGDQVEVVADRTVQLFLERREERGRKDPLDAAAVDRQKASHRAHP